MGSYPSHEQISWDEGQAISRDIRKAGKTVDRQSMLDEVRDREAFVDQKKKTRKDRRNDFEFHLECFYDHLMEAT